MSKTFHNQLFPYSIVFQVVTVLLSEQADVIALKRENANWSC